MGRKKRFWPFPNLFPKADRDLTQGQQPAWKEEQAASSDGGKGSEANLREVGQAQQTLFSHLHSGRGLLFHSDCCKKTDGCRGLGFKFMNGNLNRC